MPDLGAENRRLEFARHVYEEVLDATKHQDDKIGRFLAAIAFLFAGAVAFGTRARFSASPSAFSRLRSRWLLSHLGPS